MAISFLLGKLVDAEALTNSDTYVGQALDLVSATHNLPGGSHIWIYLSAAVAADYTTGNETYEFQIRTGTGTDGTDINAGARTIISTGAIDGDDVRVDTAGDFILRCTLPMEAYNARYLQLYYDQSGTTPTITVDFELSAAKPRTNFNIQVENSNVGTP